MYQTSGRSFTQVLESIDPSEQYVGTALEGLDAFQRQLKRFDIHVKGSNSDLRGEVFPHAGFLGALPGVRGPRGAHGHGGAHIRCPRSLATTTVIDAHGLPQRLLRAPARRTNSSPGDVAEGAAIPATVQVQDQGEPGAACNKRGRMLVASYEAHPVPEAGPLRRDCCARSARPSRPGPADATPWPCSSTATATPTRVRGPVPSARPPWPATKGTLAYDSAAGAVEREFAPYEMNTFLVAGSDGHAGAAEGARAAESPDGPELPGHRPR